MQTLGDILTFVKDNGRITSTDEDTLLRGMINESYLRLARKQPWPGLMTSGTLTTINGTQNYDLPADFDRMYESSIRYNSNLPSTPWPNGWIVPIVSGEGAEIYESFGVTQWPSAARIIQGTGALRAIRFLPQFTATPVTVAFSYYRKPTVLVGDSDILEEPNLCEAIAWDVLRSEVHWSRDTYDPVFLEQRARRAYYSALSTIQQ